jgi:Ser/Thr protein kinase RdoA (MazF antagonist)
VAVKRADGGKEQSYVRLLKYIEGNILLHAAPSAQLYRSVGAFGAKLDLVSHAI